MQPKLVYKIMRFVNGYIDDNSDPRDSFISDRAQYTMMQSYEQAHSDGEPHDNLTFLTQQDAVNYINMPDLKFRDLTANIFVSGHTIAIIPIIEMP